MKWDNWIMDCSMVGQDGLYCFLPVELDEGGVPVCIVTGMNYLSDFPPPGNFLGVWHPTEPAAAKEWADSNKDLTDRWKSNAE